MGTSKKILRTPEIFLLSHDIDWPVIEDRPPESHQHLLSERADFWQRQAMALYLVSLGFSLSTEVRSLMAAKLGIRQDAGSLRRVIESLLDAKFLVGRVLSLRASKGIPMQLIRLTRRGRSLCSQLHWRTKQCEDDPVWLPYETAWERMRRVHEKGKREPAHTLAVQAFGYQARKRGWQAGVMPMIHAKRFVPDVILVRGDDRIFVEVELGYDNQAKWKNMAAYQGFVALCARTPAHRETLIMECDIVDVPIQVTDLTTLFLEGDKALWRSR